MTIQNNKARLLYNIKLCVSFHIHQWIQTGVTVWKRPIWVKLDNFFSCVTLQFDVWPWKTIGHLFYATSSFVHHFVAIGEFNLSYSPETLNLGKIRRFLEPCDLETCRMTFKNNRKPLLFYFKLCALFRSHWWIQTWVTVRKRPIWVKFDDFLEPCYFEIWRMTLKSNRAPLLCYFKLYASFRSHKGIQTGVTVRKRTISIKIDDFF